jgi:two-component system sensor histidine kinase UhpB
MATGGLYAIKNARQNVKIEVASTAILALHMLDSEIIHQGESVNTARITDGSIFRLKNLKDVRHVEISFYDASGKLRDSNRSQLSNKVDLVSAPSWFVGLMDTVTDDMPVAKRQVFRAGKIIGELVITPDPSYEIAEVWQETTGLLMLIGLFFIVVNIVIYFFVGRALKPIDNILLALTELEKGNLKIRLPQFTLPELTKISNKFNVMAKALQESIANNRHLTQQLLKIQEDERKSLARELHDEIGQHLTAIHVDASTIMHAQTIEETRESASAIDTVSRQMMEIVHTLLQRLRPNSLDDLGLDIALQELINSWNLRHNRIKLSYSLQGDFNHFDETLLITIYRLVQECLTNISRHAKARHVAISVKKKDKIYVTVNDDGKGFDLSVKQTGFGLAGMRERVEGLLGSLEIMTSFDQGVTINIELPYEVG